MYKKEMSSISFFLFFFSFSFFFKTRVCLCSPSCPGTSSVDQAGLKFRDPPTSSLEALGLEVCAPLCPAGPHPFLFHKKTTHRGLLPNGHHCLLEFVLGTEQSTLSVEKRRKGRKENMLLKISFS